MTPAMHAELIAIAQAADLPCFRALDKLATVMPTSSHCDKCSQELSSVATAQCPKCGAKLKSKLNLKKTKARLENKGTPEGERPQDDALGSGDPGAEAAVDEELQQGSLADTGKYAAAAALPQRLEEFLGKKLGKKAANGVGATALGGGLLVGNEGRKSINSSEQSAASEAARRRARHYASKIASARCGANPIGRIRTSKKSQKPSVALARINEATKNFTKATHGKAKKSR